MRPLLQDWERWIFYLMHRNQHRDSRKMKKQRNMFPTKEKDKTLDKDINEMEIRDLPDKEFKITVIKMLIGLGKSINDQSENLNKERENIRKYQTEVTELKK